MVPPSPVIRWVDVFDLVLVGHGKDVCFVVEGDRLDGLVLDGGCGYGGVVDGLGGFGHWFVPWLVFSLVCLYCIVHV